MIKKDYLERNSEEIPYTQQQLMKVFDVSNTKFWRMSKAGQLPPWFLIGSRKRWDRGTVRRWIHQQESKN